ncbi:unnamed protein product [Mytilus coruscus]|uniref:B box-type domain-containing protein n=1 Tax=Mytilus coruscus TaxID=42192 RepID=A0A6J8CS29_MYTCO|nr:unnamed protein product [Mytilus coruscus]
MDVNDKKDLCSPCEFKNKTNEAAKWCIDCKEPLCVSCYEHHNVHRSSRNHHVISVESNQMLESLQKRLNEYCEYHHQEKDLYCSTHSEFICLTCTNTSHGKCKPAVGLSEVTKNAKMSPFVSVRKIQSINIDTEKNPEIFATCGKIKSYGNIQVETLNKGYCIFKKIKGQYPKDIESKTIYKFSKTLEIKIPPRSIIDNFAMLPGKQMIFVDSQVRYKTLIIFNDYGTHDRNIKLSCMPFDIDVIGNDKLALSFPLSTRKRIEMINTTNNRLEHEIVFLKTNVLVFHTINVDCLLSSRMKGF